MIAKVVFSKPPENEFDYRVPDGLKVLKGQRVLVPFKYTKRIGYVVSVCEEYDQRFKLKDIERVVDEIPLIDEKTFEFANSLARYYFVGVGEILNLILPSNYPPFAVKHTPGFVASASFSTIPKIQVAFLDSSKRYGFYKDKVAEVINSKKSALLVLPTLSDILWAQSFFADFKPVAWHSKMGDRKQIELFKKIITSESIFVIATRRGLFLPINNLHTIVVEREYNYAHKDGQTPYYHSREVAIAKSEFFRVNVIFGGLVFSTQLYARIKGDTAGIFQRERSKFLQTTTSLPCVYTKNPYCLITSSGDKKDLFAELWDELDRSYALGRVAVIHYPRRGFSTGFYCVNCKTILKCPECEVAIRSFKSTDTEKLRCNYCGKGFSQPPSCLSCKSINIYPLSFGTQRIEEIIKKRYPSARVVRYDLDSKRDTATQIDADFIVATHPPPPHGVVKKVGLVIVLCADFDFFHPEYFSNEKIFLKLADYYDLLLSGDANGKMYVETRFENYYVFKTHYTDFYTEELKNRKRLKYPPFTRLVELNITSKNLTRIERDVYKIINSLEDIVQKTKSEIELLGPSKKHSKKYHRWRILLKGVGDFHSLISLVKSFEESSVKIKIDASI